MKLYRWKSEAYWPRAHAVPDGDPYPWAMCNVYSNQFIAAPDKPQCKNCLRYAKLHGIVVAK